MNTTQTGKLGADSECPSSWGRGVIFKESLCREMKIRTTITILNPSLAKGKGEGGQRVGFGTSSQIDLLVIRCARAQRKGVGLGGLPRKPPVRAPQDALPRELAGPRQAWT